MSNLVSSHIHKGVLFLKKGKENLNPQPFQVTAMYLAFTFNTKKSRFIFVHFFSELGTGPNHTLTPKVKWPSIMGAKQVSMYFSHLRSHGLIVSCAVKHITGSNPSSLSRLNFLLGNKEWKGTRDEL